MGGYIGFRVEGLNSLTGIIMGSLIGVIKVDTRSLDYSSYAQ